jgi:hypothetical protein
MPQLQPVSLPRRRRRSARSLLGPLVLIAALCTATHAYADDRTEARAHYQAGVTFYGKGDYQGAIREFSAAQQLAPADLNNYNLGLCYDKLGEAEPAVQYYRAFLDKQPNTEKRTEIEASISRLEAASRSAAGKKAKPAGPPAPDSVAGSPAPPAIAAGPTLGPVPAPSAGAPAAPPSSEPAAGPPPPPSMVPPPPPSVVPPPPGQAKHHGPAVAAPTGDPQVDRVNGISIDEVRDQRMGGAAATGPTEHRPPGPAVAANDAGQPAPTAPPIAPNSQPTAPNSQPAAPDQPPPEAPVYKKWWFWGLVAVTGYVVYELATTSSSSNNVGRIAPASKQPRGITLLSW